VAATADSSELWLCVAERRAVEAERALETTVQRGLTPSSRLIESPEEEPEIDAHAARRALRREQWPALELDARQPVQDRPADAERD
jgi:hypothetical protein